MNKKRGDFYAICDGCGMRFWRSQLKRDGYGLLMCREDFDIKHPQETPYKPRPNETQVHDPNPEGEITYI